MPGQNSNGAMELNMPVFQNLPRPPSESSEKLKRSKKNKFCVINVAVVAKRIKSSRPLLNQKKKTKVTKMLIISTTPQMKTAATG